MAYLATPYTVAYASMNYVSGLQGIYCVIRKPDGETVGPFPMVEGTFYFSGVYTCEYISQITDTPGRYLAAIVSPQEAGHQSTVGFELVVPPPGTGPVGTVDKSLVLGKLAPTPAIVGQFEQADAVGEIRQTIALGKINFNEPTGYVNKKEIEGKTYELP